MSVEIYGNFKPQIEQHIDSRLKTVTTVADLPDPNIPSNFIYEGAIAYVAGTVDKFYKCVVTTGTTKEWVPFVADDLVIGTINITPSTTVLDLNLVSPAIDECYAVQINIVGGTSANIQTITNFPGSDKLITFFVQAGQDVTFKHVNYDVASTDQIVLEVGFDMKISGRTIGNESLTLKRHGVANCQWDATQFVKSTEWIQNLLSQAVVDNLLSTSTVMPLSANQGRVLKLLVDGKQQQLTPGQKISLTPGVTTTTIDSLPRDWEQVIIAASPAPGTATDVFIAGQVSGTSEEYRFVDLRNSSDGSRGLWMLPPNHVANVAGNWIMLDSPVGNIGHLRLTYAADSNLTDNLVSNRYYMRNLVSGTGNTIDTIPGTSHVFNGDGIAGEKTSLRLNNIGVYEVKLDVVIQINDVTPRYINAYIHLTDGVQSYTNPINTGTLIKTAPFSGDDGTSNGRYAQLTTSFTFEVTAANIDDTIAVGLGELSNNLANITIQSNSTIQVTKHS